MSTGLASQALQAALYTRLHGDATLVTTYGCGVYDGPPSGSSYPYIVIGEVEESPNNRMGGTVGRELVASIHAYTSDESMLNLQKILGRVDALLDNDLSLSVTGYTVERIDFDSNTLEHLEVVAASLRHGLSRYRVNLVEA